MTTLTIADLETSPVREVAFLDGGEVWFGYMYACVQHPRLQRLDRCDRAARTVTEIWYVDGYEVGPDLAEAVPLLNALPRLTAEEGLFLRLVTRDWQDLRERGGNLGLGPLFGLRNKGVVEFQGGRCRRRPDARWDFADAGAPVHDAPADRDAYLELLRKDAEGATSP